MGPCRGRGKLKIKNFLNADFSYISIANCVEELRGRLHVDQLLIKIKEKTENHINRTRKRNYFPSQQDYTAYEEQRTTE
jgi:predicted nucleic acid-binding OB-fold protein